MSELSRRQFMSRSVAAAGAVGATAAAGAAPLLGIGDSIRGANDRIRIALIGSGGQGRVDIGVFLLNKEVDCPLICDVDDKQIAAAGAAIEKARGRKPEAVKDWREVMDRRDIDAVLVATPDHWHALPTMHACQAGKDVYVEKPLATTVIEGQAMLDAARRYNRVVQMGTQWRSSKSWMDAAGYVQSGKLGKIRQVRLWAYLNWVHSVGKPKDGPVPEGVDYDMWLGPAPMHPFNPARFHFSFRWFWDYAGGLMTDWGVHLINIAMHAMGMPDPVRVSSSGGKYVYDDISDTPDTQMALYEFPNYIMIWEHQMSGSRGPEGREHGIAFYGTDGTLIVDGAGWEVNPTPNSELPAEKHKSDGDGRPEHIRNFLDCMSSREKPVEDVEVGHRISTVAHLGNLALRTGHSIEWDAENRRAKDNAAANLLLSRRYRAPWKLEV